MASRDTKQLKSSKAGVAQSGRYDFSVMKPFVKFGIGAMSTIAHTLITIVKNIPKPHHHDDDKPGRDKIIKI